MSISKKNGRLIAEQYSKDGVVHYIGELVGIMVIPAALIKRTVGVAIAGLYLVVRWEINFRRIS